MLDVVLLMVAVAGVGLVLALLAAFHPILARMAARNAVRRRSRVLIVTFGLLIGTMIISSSLTVGDTLEYIFTGDVYDSFDAIDIIVSNEIEGRTFAFPEAHFATLRSEAVARGAPFDGMAPVLEKVMPVRNGLTGNQGIIVQGLNEMYEGGFGDLRNRVGAAVSLAALPTDRVYVNERAAKDLNASVGDELILFYGTTNQTIIYVHVEDIVRAEGKGDYQHLSLIFAPLAIAQAWFNATGTVSYVKVSATGPAIGGEVNSGALADELARIVNGHGWRLDVHQVKIDGLEQARSISDQVGELFLVMGSFAITAGVLLIVNVFVMLAEERKAEMGVSRAIGMKRFHLTLAFLFEGSLYVLLAAVAGAFAGVGLGWTMIQIFNVLFPPADGQSPLAFHAEPKSVVLAFCAGVLITLAAVALASAAVSRLNIVRALRNLPEPPGTALTQVQRWLVFLALFGGVLLLVRGFEWYRLPWAPLDLSPLPYAAGAVLLAGLVGYLAAALTDREAIVRYTGTALQVVFLGFVLALGYNLLAQPTGPSESVGVYRVAAVPALFAGSAILASRRFAARLPYTLAGLGILWWLLYPPVDLVDEGRDDISVLFVETGVLLVLGAILVAVYNTSPALRFLLDRLGRKGRPVVRAAVTYPMGKKFRTGMTLAMFSLTIFSITVIAMVQGLQAASLDKFVAGQSGGYQVAAYAQGYVPIDNFTDELQRRNVSMAYFLNGPAGVATATVIPVQVNKTGDPEVRDYTLWGVDNFLIEKNTYDFLSFLPRVEYVDPADNVTKELTLTTREDVWRAVHLNWSYAVVDRGAAGADQFTPDLGQLRLNLGDHISARDAEGNAREIVILGILEQSLQFTRGIFVDREPVLDTYNLTFARTAYFFQLAPGVDATKVRQELEQKFFEFGLVTIDIREEIETQFEASDRVLLLMQAYLALGLLVGVTGLGVITIRAVVERRQEIGALRALGFTRRMVGRMFLLEISLIALMGIAIGMALGVILAQRVWEVYFASIAVFTVPWLHLGLVAAIAFAFTLLTTASPALRASRLPPAQTLRYIE